MTEVAQSCYSAKTGAEYAKRSGYKNPGIRAVGVRMLGAGLSDEE